VVWKLKANDAQHRNAADRRQLEFARSRSSRRRPCSRHRWQASYSLGELLRIAAASCALSFVATHRQIVQMLTLASVVGCQPRHFQPITPPNPAFKRTRRERRAA